MKQKLKNFTALMGVLCLTQGIAYGSALTLNYDGQSHIYDKAPISLYVNNTLIESAIMPPVQIEDYVLVPTREVFSAMDASVQWKSEEKKVYIEENNSLLVLELNSKEAWVNGEVKTMDMPPKMVNDKLMVPIRFISETLGFSVEWLGVERCVYINGGGRQHMSGNNNSGDNNQVNETPEQNIIKPSIPEENDMSHTLNHKLPMLTYDKSSQTMTLAAATGANVSHITVDDIYTKRKLVFNISDCELSEITTGSWQGSLGYLKGVTVTKTETGAQLVVETSTVCATTLDEHNGEVTIKFMKPKEKYNKIIVVDAGHGGHDSGTTSNGILEKDLTLSFGKALYNELEGDSNIKVYATRPADVYATEGDGVVGKQYPTLNMRVDLANEIHPDLYISIHVNYYENEAASGIETYYYPSDKKGQAFAQMVQKALVNEFGMNDRKIKTKDLYVINNTNESAILIETGFISNGADREIITSGTYPNKFAQTVYNCILDYYEQGLNK